jgi:hypothetical protein
MEEDMDRDSTVVLSVYFEGTANSLEALETQVGIFAAATVGTDLSEYEAGMLLRPDIRGPFKVAFDGCGVTNGILGTLFAAGLEGQCDFVVMILKELLATGLRRVVMNCLGLSRGGLALMILAQKLASLEVDQIACTDLNLCIFDPVPGNLVGTGFPFTGWGRSDLSTCTCLRRVLAIYPYEPLPDYYFHAPTLCKYPSCAQVEEDVTLGCHMAAMAPMRQGATHRWRLASNTSFRRIFEFITSVGTKVNVDPHGFYQPSDDDCLGIYRRELDLHIREVDSHGHACVYGDGQQEVVADAPSSRRVLHDGYVVYIFRATRNTLARTMSSLSGCMLR